MKAILLSYGKGTDIFVAFIQNGMSDDVLGSLHYKHIKTCSNALSVMVNPEACDFFSWKSTLPLCFTYVYLYPLISDKMSWVIGTVDWEKVTINWLFNEV